MVKLNLLVIRMADLAAARAFYESIGLVFSVEKHGTGPEHLACTLGDTVFEIYPGATGETANCRLGFEVSALDEVVARVAANGAVVVRPPAMSPWGRRATLADPDGRRVEVYEIAV